MLGNYLKVALRNLLRHKGYSLINIAGLAIGMACCILIMLWVFDEVSYDRFHTQADNIYRIVGKNPGPDGVRYSITMPAPIGPGIKDMAPEIVDFVRLGIESRLLEYGDKGFSLRTALVDSTFFSMFYFPLLDGNPQTALSDPYSIVLTAETAA
ncbi:ABC transporter permease, partial [Candidatus Zixiibacteriota bacterium]